MPVSALLRKFDQASPLNSVVRAALQRLPVHIKHIAASQIILREGDQATSSIMVLSGDVFRSKLVGDGKRQILSFHIAGDIPDMQSLFLQTMDHNLSTVGAAEIAHIPHDALKALFLEHPSTAALFWRDTLVDASIFREWIANTGRRRAVSRMAHLLCEIMTRSRVVGLVTENSCAMHMTQSHFADALGLSMVHVNRSLQELRAAKSIVLSHGQLTILDWAKLIDIGDFDEGYLHLEPLH